MVHAGVARHAYLQEIRPLSPGASDKAPDHVVQFPADASGQRFGPAGKRIIGTHDHIGTVLRLRIHPALRRVQKEPGQRRRTEIKGGQTVVSFLILNIQNLPIRMRNMAVPALFYPFIERGRQFRVRQELSGVFCSGFRQGREHPFPIRTPVSGDRLFQRNGVDRDSRPESHRSGKSFRQHDGLFQGGKAGCIDMKVLLNLRLAGLYGLPVYRHLTFPAGARPAAGRVRKKAGQPFRLQNRSALRHFDLSFLSVKIYLVHTDSSIFCIALLMSVYHKKTGSTIRTEKAHRHRRSQQFRGRHRQPHPRHAQPFRQDEQQRQEQSECPQKRQ